MPDDRHAYPGPTTLGREYPIGYLVTVGCMPMELGLEKYFLGARYGYVQLR